MISDQKKAIEKFYKWMENFLERPHKEIGGWPLCPFAKKSRITDKIYISFIDMNNISEELNRSLSVLESKDVVVLMFEPKDIDGNELLDFIYFNNKILMRKDYVLISDHPDNKEELNGINVNFNEYGLILIFKLKNLNKLTLELKNKGYFKYWPKERIEELINWRFKKDIVN